MTKLVMIICAAFFISCKDMETYNYGKVIAVQSGIYGNICTIKFTDGNRTSFMSNELIVGDSIAIRNTIIGRVLTIIE